MPLPEKFCPLHGPYDATLAECPYCVAERDNSRSSQSAHAAPLASRGENGHISDDEVFPDLEMPSSNLSEEGQRAFLERTLLDRSPSTPPKPSLRGLLWVKRGPLEGHIFPIEDGTIIGRTVGTVVLRDPRVSNPHAKLKLTEKGFVLWDFGSTNGTFVNGERILAATLLAENDEIQVGDTILVLKTLSLEREHERRSTS